MTENSDKCNQIVLEGQDAFYCDNCEKGAPSKCLKISKTLFKNLENPSEPWFCDLCKKKDELGNNKIKGKAVGSKDYTTNDIMAKLMVTDKKYQNILQKYEDQLRENQELRKEITTIKNN